MTPEGIGMLRKICIRLAMSLHTNIDYFEGLTLYELLDTIKEVSEIGRSKQRDGNRHKNRR